MKAGGWQNSSISKLDYFSSSQKPTLIFRFPAIWNHRPQLAVQFG